MAYLLIFIVATLIIVILMTPASLTLLLGESIEATLSLPFFDVSLSNTGDGNGKNGRKKKRNLKIITRLIKASKRSVDILLRNSKLTVYRAHEKDLPQSRHISKTKQLLFSVLISYLASKSGILITNEGAPSEPYGKMRERTSLLIETRILTLVISLISFTVIRYFPKKEHGFVR